MDAKESMVQFQRLMRSLSRWPHWPHTSGSWGRRMGREERGELSLCHTDQVRLPAFPLHIPAGRVRRAHGSQPRGVKTPRHHYTETFECRRKTCKSTLFCGQRL